MPVSEILIKDFWCGHQCVAGLFWQIVRPCVALHLFNVFFWWSMSIKHAYVFVNEAFCDLSSENRAEEEPNSHQTAVRKYWGSINQFCRKETLCVVLLLGSTGTQNTTPPPAAAAATGALALAAAAAATSQREHMYVETVTQQAGGENNAEL